MDLINQYVYAVVRHLPAAQRADIEKEIRAMIDELLHERVKNQADTAAPGQEKDGQPVFAESDMRAVLENLGDPAVLAKQYRGKDKYVIGPVLYDTYTLVLKIVLSAVGIGLLIAKSIQLASQEFEYVWEAFAGLIGSLYQGLLSAFAVVTLIFILIEQFGGQEIEAEINKENEKKTWSLDDLPQVPSAKLLIKKSDPAVTIVFSMIFLTIINVFPQLFGFYQQTEAGIQITGFLGEGFSDHLIWINAFLVLGIILEAVKIALGRWTWFLVWSCILQNVFSLVVSLRVVRDEAFINPEFIAAINRFLEDNSVDVTVVWQNPVVTGLSILIIIGFFAETISIGMKGYRLIQAKNEV